MNAVSNIASISKYISFGDQTIAIIEESSNRKLQTWNFGGKVLTLYIIPTTTEKFEDFMQYEDVVCASECPHTKRNLGDCYVNSMSVFSVMRGYRSAIEKGKVPQIFFNKSHYGVRATAHGDIASLNFEGRMFVYNLLAQATGVRAYTSGWARDNMQMFSEVCMASVNSIEDAERAQRLGWRTYRARVGADSTQVISAQRHLRETNCVVLGNGHAFEQGRGCFGNCATPCNGKLHNVVSPDHDKLKRAQKKFDMRISLQAQAGV